jgi:hypothetical protein
MSRARAINDFEPFEEGANTGPPFDLVYGVGLFSGAARRGHRQAGFWVKKSKTITKPLKRVGETGSSLRDLNRYFHFPQR